MDSFQNRMQNIYKSVEMVMARWKEKRFLFIRVR